MLMQNFVGITKSIMVFLKKAYSEILYPENHTLAAVASTRLGQTRECQHTPSSSDSTSKRHDNFLLLTVLAAQKIRSCLQLLLVSYKVESTKPTRRGGGGVVPSVWPTGMCRCTGYGF